MSTNLNGDHVTDGFNGTVADLATGDRLLHLGGVGFAQLIDPDADPVLVGDVHPAPDDKALSQVVTSAGTIYAYRDTEAGAIRSDVVTASTILLISRRHMLGAALTTLGTPIVRRTPVDPGTNTPAVTGQEFASAPLVVIDAYLSKTTLRSMWMRGDLSDRDQIVMVGTDPDDPRAFDRQATARARTLMLLPHDEALLRSLFRTATNTATGGDRAPFPGVLTAMP